MEARVKAAVAAQVMAPEAAKPKISSLPAMELAAADKTVRWPSPKRKPSSDDFEERELGQDFAARTDGVMVALAAAEDLQSVPSDAQAQAAVVSDAPAALSMSFKALPTAATTQASPSMPGWTDVFMAIDQISGAGVLGGVALVAAAGGQSGSSPAVPSDTTPPTVVVTNDKSFLTKGQTANITFTLSAASTNFTVDDVVVSGGTLSNFSGSGTTYTATFTPAVNSTTPGTVRVASGQFTDAAGNQNADGADANNLVTMPVDTVAPVAPIARLDGSWTVNPQVTMSIDLGAGSAQEVVVEVYPNAAPGTVANWLAYVNTDYYRDLIFHRVISGFMTQAGAFTSDLVQHAATYAPIALETTLASGLSNLSGTLAMARTDIADSATSQFFINMADNMFLNYGSASSPGYAVFGKVVSGMSTVNSITSVATGTVNGMADVPNSAITLNSVSETSAGTAYSSSGKIYLSALEQGAHYSYSLDGGAWTSLGTSQTWIDLGSGLAIGSHAVEVRQIDSAGNPSASTAVLFTQYVPDFVHSVLDLATVSDTSGGTDGTATDNITQSTSLSLSAALPAWAGQSVWLMEQGHKVDSTVADSSGNLAWQVTGASLGDHLYTLYDPVHQVRITEGNIATSELLVRVI